MSVQIITDSHSGMSRREAEELGVLRLSMPFALDGVDYLEDNAPDRETFFAKLSAGAVMSTSQSSPAEIMALWDEALKHHDQVVFMPLSSGLSGACATAKILADEPEYEGKVFVVDNGRIATPLYRSVLDALEMAQKGMDGAEICRALEDSREEMSIYVAANTLEYLKRGGRVSATTAAVGTLLGIRPVLHLDVGVLTGFKNPRGLAGAKKTMIEAMRNDLETKFREQYESGNVHLLAASNGSPEMVEKWIGEIQNAFPGMEVQYAPLSLGISCHIGPDALGIGCSCVPAVLRK